MNRQPHTRDPGTGQDLLAHMVNRRRFLSMLASAGALGATGCAQTGPRPGRQNAIAAPTGAVDEQLSLPSSTATAERRRPVNGNRRLVVIELSGGSDGLAMLQPWQSGVLRDRRPELMSADEELIDAGNGFGWHPSLAGLAEIGIAAAVGVGSNEPDFSHFEMEQRWWQGVSDDNSRVATGFFGRLCDQLDVGDPVSGLSFSGGPTPGLASDRAVTVGLTDPGANWFLRQDEPWFDMLQSTYGAMAEPTPGDSDRFAAARGGLADTTRFAESLATIDSPDDGPYPWTDLGQQMRFAAEVMALDVGVRVMHVTHGGFDTHTGQEWRYRDLMTELNDATVAFVDDLKSRNLFEDTLIVTTSEFGRRVTSSEGGTDHGGASTMMVCAPGTSGVHGEAPNLNKLDDGNLVATARFEDYYATIAEDWFGIGATDVLPAGGTPISGLI